MKKQNLSIISVKAEKLSAKQTLLLKGGLNDAADFVIIEDFIVA